MTEMFCDNKEKPSREEVLKFLQILDRLCDFEAQQRLIRGHGSFDKEQLPIPEVVSVIKWLNDSFNITNDDIQAWKKS